MFTVLGSGGEDSTRASRARLIVHFGSSGIHKVRTYTFEVGLMDARALGWQDPD